MMLFKDSYWIDKIEEMSTHKLLLLTRLVLLTGKYFN